MHPTALRAAYDRQASSAPARMSRPGFLRPLFACAALALLPFGAHAQIEGRSTSDKLLLTAGVSQVEGAAGGGLVPWGVIGGYGTRDQFGGSAFATRVELDDYALDSRGVLFGIFDRVEVSIAQQRFDTRAVGAALGLGRGFTLDQDIYGAKLRVFGDAVYDQDRWWPQISIGVQHKRHGDGAVVRSLGADDRGTDVYVAATKLYLAQSMLVNVTLRSTDANQLGLLGFGGDDGGRSLQLEGSVAWLLSRRFAVGAEYRGKPDNLSAVDEQHAWDVFAAWTLSKHLALTLAYVDLGTIAIADDQRGWYGSVQVGF